MWECEVHNLEARCISLIRNVRLQHAVSNIGRNSISYFNLRRRGCRKFSDLDLNSLESISRFLPKNLATISRAIVNLNVNLDVSSKIIREGRKRAEPICIFKGGLVNTPAETLNWAYKISKIN